MAFWPLTVNSVSSIFIFNKKKLWQLSYIFACLLVETDVGKLDGEHIGVYQVPFKGENLSGRHRCFWLPVFWCMSQIEFPEKQTLRWRGTYGNIQEAGQGRGRGWAVMHLNRCLSQLSGEFWTWDDSSQLPWVEPGTRPLYSHVNQLVDSGHPRKEAWSWVRQLSSAEVGLHRGLTAESFCFQHSQRLGVSLLS